MFTCSGVRSHSITAFEGDTVHLKCGHGDTVVTPVDWLHQLSSDAKIHFIISAGFLTNGYYENRLNISGSTLIIINVKKEDRGVYTCVERAGLGRRHHVVLMIQGWRYT